MSTKGIIMAMVGSSMRVAFLRGINVGGHNVKSAVLCDVLTNLGLTGVRTFIASGNLLFGGDEGGNIAARDGARRDAPVDAELEARIGAALEERLGWPVPTFVRSPSEVAAAAAHPFAQELAPTEGQTLHVGFWHEALPATAGDRLRALSTPNDEVRVHGRELYWLCRGPVHRSKVTPARLERAGGGPVTCRSITTIGRLLDLVGA